MSDEYEENAPSHPNELWLMVRRHDRDLYRGNGKPGVTIRLNDLENYKRRTENDLYNSETGIVPKMNEFLTIQKDREKQSSKKNATLVTLVAAVAVLAPVLWDVIKHSLGWLTK